MPEALRVSEVRFQVASRSQRERGQLGWATFVVGGSLKVSAVSVRRRLDGELALSFPTRRSRAGVEFPILSPISAQARAGIEGQVLAALRQEGVL